MSPIQSGRGAWPPAIVLVCALVAVALTGCTSREAGQPGQPGTSSFSLGKAANFVVPGSVSARTAGQNCIILAMDGLTQPGKGNATLSWAPGGGSTQSLGLTLKRSDGKPGLSATGPSPLTLEWDRLPAANGTAATPVTISLVALGGSGVAPTLDQQVSLRVVFGGTGQSPTVATGSC